MRARIAVLPAEVRDELAQKLRANAHSQFGELSQWLRGLGFKIGRSQIGRFSLALRVEDREGQRHGVIISPRAFLADIRKVVERHVGAADGAGRVQVDGCQG